MFTITKEFRFEAAHSLSHLPASHKCSRLHGHQYIVIVELSRAELDDCGFVEDFGELDDIREHIDVCFDHRNLDDVLGHGARTTAENIARYFYDAFIGDHPLMTAVTVRETINTSATYRPALAG